MFDLPTRRQLEIPALGQTVGTNHSGLIAEEKASGSCETSFVKDCLPDVAKGLVVLLSDHPALPLEVSVDCVMEVEVVEDGGETPHSSRILRAASGFILSLNVIHQVKTARTMLPSNSG